MIGTEIITVGGKNYEVRPMTGVLRGFEVWLGEVEVGFFTVRGDGKVDSTASMPEQVEHVLILLVAADYVRKVLRLRCPP